MRWWKVLGFAGFAGVAATGVLIARDERRRRAYTPQEIRDVLHRRLTEARGGPGETAGAPGAAVESSEEPVRRPVEGPAPQV